MFALVLRLPTPVPRVGRGITLPDNLRFVWRTIVELSDLVRIFGRENLYATRLRDCWAIRPTGCLGTSGWVDGKGWNVVYTKNIPNGIPVENK